MKHFVLTLFTFLISVSAMATDGEFSVPVKCIYYNSELFGDTAVERELFIRYYNREIVINVRGGDDNFTAVRDLATEGLGANNANFTASQMAGDQVKIASLHENFVTVRLLNGITGQVLNSVTCHGDQISQVVSQLRASAPTNPN